MKHDPDTLALALLELHGNPEAQQRLLGQHGGADDRLSRSDTDSSSPAPEETPAGDD